MTNEMKQARDEHLMAALCVLVTSGHAIEQNGCSIRRISDNEIAVQGAAVAYEVFQDVRSAVAYYLDLCDPA